MSTLPPASDLTGSSVTEGQFKAGLASVIAVVGETQAGLANEVTARQALATTAASNLAAETSARNAAIAGVNANIATETSARQSADAGLAADISAETSAREAAVAGVASDLAAETSARQSAVSTLTSNLNAEINARQSAVGSLNTAVAAEIQSRTAADTTLTNNLAAEVSARQAAVSAGIQTAKDYADSQVTAEATARTNAVASEATARANADTTLTNNLNAEITARQTAVSGEATARAAADTTLSNNLATEITNRQAAVSAEASARASAVTTLTDNLNTEISNRQTAVAAGVQTAKDYADTKVSDEVTARNAAIAAETTARNAAISGEVTARQAADTTLTNNLAAEVTARTNAVAAEASARTTADNALAQNIANEAATREAAINSLTGNVTAVLPNMGIYKNDIGGISVTDTAGNTCLFSTGDGRVYANLPEYARLKDLVLLMAIGAGLKNTDNPYAIVDGQGFPGLFTTNDGRTYGNLPEYIRKTQLADAVKNLGVGYNPFKGVTLIGISYGQSNNLGTGANQTTVLQPYNNIMMNLPNNQTRYGQRNSAGVAQYAPTALVPLKEAANESTLSATINDLTRRILADRIPAEDVVFAGLCGGNGGTSFAQLSKGAAIMPDNDDPPNALNDFAYNWFDCLRLAMQDLVGFINTTTRKPLPGFLNITEGEADLQLRTSKQDYMDLQRGFVSDFSEVCYQQMGVPFTGPVVFNQCCAMRSYVRSDISTPVPDQFRKPFVPQAQLEMGLNDANMILACPDYPFARKDYVHFDDNTQPLHCAYKARALKAWFAGKKWKPLHVAKCEWFNDYILLTYHLPAGSRLQLETSQVTAAPNMGFDLWQTAATVTGIETISGAITSVVLQGPDRIRINLAANYPAGTLLTYAWGRIDDPTQVAGPVSGPRGNVADTFGNVEKFTLPVSQTVYDMHNYAVVQDFTRA